MTSLLYIVSSIEYFSPDGKARPPNQRRGARGDARVERERSTLAGPAADLRSAVVDCGRNGSMQACCSASIRPRRDEPASHHPPRSPFVWEAATAASGKPSKLQRSIKSIIHPPTHGGTSPSLDDWIDEIDVRLTTFV